MTHTTMIFRSRRIRELRPFLRELASYRFHFSALASATSNGIGERLHQQRILGSGGCHFVIRYVVADNLSVVCFQKSSCCLSCCMFVPVMLCDAAVMGPALSTSQCHSPAALVAPSGNQGGWFAAFACALGL